MITSCKKGILFTKMHGAGNDYVYIDALREAPDNLPLLSKQISDRHFGVGSDGLVAIFPSEVADFRMRMFNADGSEAQMCGNASRCIAKYVFEKGLTDKTEISLETLAGIKILKLDVADGIVKSVTVDMGEPTFEPDEIPFAGTGNGPHRVTLETGLSYEVTAVGMGNPHAVVFVDAISDDIVLGSGPALEESELFPEKTNVEFIKVLDPGHMEMRVWERGSGETLACGTGACASVVAAALRGKTGRDVEVILRGGRLRVNWDETTNHVFLTGGAEFIADGVFYPCAAIESGVL